MNIFKIHLYNRILYCLPSYILLVFLLTNCKKERNSTTAEGYILNYYNSEPIDSVKITLTDGIYAGTPPADFKYPKKSIVYTNKQGYFVVTLDNPDESPFFYANKIGYRFDPDWSDGAYVGVHTIGYGLHTNQAFQLKPDTSFCATIINKGMVADSMKLSFFDFRPSAYDDKYSKINYKIYTYGKNVENNKMYFSGNGPWNTCNSGFIHYQYATTYLRYKIELRRNSIWTSIIDSINLESLDTYGNTYNRAVIEIR